MQNIGAGLWVEYTKDMVYIQTGYCSFVLMGKNNFWNYGNLVTVRALDEVSAPFLKVFFRIV